MSQLEFLDIEGSVATVPGAVRRLEWLECSSVGSRLHPHPPQAQRGLEGKSHDVFPSEGLRMTGAYKMKTKTDSPRRPAQLPIPPTQIRVPGPDAWSPRRQRRAKSH